MGTIRNEMTIIHDWKKDRIEKLRQDAIQTFSKSIEYEDMIGPIMTSYINEEYTFVINGDCSKLGWETSNRFHDIRIKWCENHKYDAESIVVINFGEDGPCDIIYDNNRKEDRSWCDTCEFKHLESECLGCAEYDEYDNLIDLRNYKKEE